MLGVIAEGNDIYCTPANLRKYISKSKTIPDDPFIVTALLEFALSDLGPHTYKQLRGLKLAFLASGRTGAWGGQKYVLAQDWQREMFEGKRAATVLNSFLSPALTRNAAIRAHLKRREFESLYLMPFGAHLLAKHIRLMFSSQIYDQRSMLPW